MKLWNGNPRHLLQGATVTFVYCRSLYRKYVQQALLYSVVVVSTLVPV